MRFSRLNGNLFDTIARFIPRETKRLYGSIYLVTDRNFFHDRYFEIFPPHPLHARISPSGILFNFALRQSIMVIALRTIGYSKLKGGRDTNG